MKITRRQLRKIILNEVRRLNEHPSDKLVLVSGLGMKLHPQPPFIMEEGELPVPEWLVRVMKIGSELWSGDKFGAASDGSSSITSMTLYYSTPEGADKNRDDLGRIEMEGIKRSTQAYGNTPAGEGTAWFGTLHIHDAGGRPRLQASDLDSVNALVMQALDLQ